MAEGPENPDEEGPPTMSMTPDDMEAVVRERLAEIDASDAGSPCRQAYFSPAVIRALLLDYQERGRALEEIKALPDLSKNPADAFDRGARAARLDAADMAEAALTGEDLPQPPNNERTG